MSATENQKSSKKSKSKSKKDERYEDMLKKIDLGLDQEKSKGFTAIINDDNDDDDSKSLKPGEVSLFDLMSTLENKDKAAPNNSILKTHISELNQKSVFEEAPATWKQEQMDRQANYDIIKKDVKKWEGIIKRNREAAHLDLTTKNNEKFRINSNIVHNLSKSAVEDKVEAKLKELNLFSEEDFLKEEKEMLKKLNPDEAKKRESELAKHRNLMFYQELKQKRISKIKSKLYHKIKNKREKRMQDKLMTSMDENDPMAQLKEIEELEKKRAQERISMRHKNKSKFARNMLRYGDKKESKQSVNDLAQLRREIMRKINPDQKDRLKEQLEEEEDDDLDDHQFKNKLIQEIEDQLRMEDEEETGQDGKKKKLSGFMKKLSDQAKTKNRKEAEALLERLKNTDNLDDFKLSEDEEDQKEGDMEEENPQGEETKKKKKDSAFNEQTGRKKFHKEEKNPGKIQVEDYKKNNKKAKDAKEVLDSFIENPEDHPEMAINNPTTKSLNLLAGLASKEDESGHLGRLEPKDLVFSTNEPQEEVKSEKKKKGSEKKNTESQRESANKDDLVSGLNFDTMKQKYNKSTNSQFLGDQIEKFNEENKQELYNDLANFQVVSSNIYNEEFQEEKNELYEDELPEEKKPLKGWGSWAGMGIKEKKVDPQIELRKKIEKIEELKRQRKDGNLDHVILHEERNKLVTKYLVRDLPHPYKSAAQFDYVQGLALGPDWNSMKNHQRLVKPKVITRAGEIIKPIQAPKNPNKKK